MFEGTIITSDRINDFTGRVCAVLNSRQTKTPVGNDPWVKSTLDAVKYAIGKDYTVVTSAGMNTWELVLWAVNEYGGKAIILLSEIEYSKNVDKLEYFIKDFNLKLDNFSIILVKSEQKSQSRKNWWDARDKLAIDLAYEIIPVSIRPDGRWSVMLMNTALKEKRINNDFNVEFSSKSVNEGKMVIEIPPADISYTWHRLTHWTRRFYSPWPGETAKDFYTKLVHCGNIYPHRAVDTLGNIISEKLIRGSQDHIRDSKSVVALTALSPHKSIELMKWRSRYVRYTFEPYGISIDRQAAIAMGIRPVKYIVNNKGGKDTEMKFMEDDELEFTQGYGKGNWPLEEEWRYPGDLNLSKFNPNDIIVIVQTIEEAIQMENLSPWRVISLESIDLAGITQVVNLYLNL
jgi:hypothetical protein